MRQLTIFDVIDEKAYIDFDTMSPIMRQFCDIKKQYPDALLLFRSDDFYEAYAQDAVDVSNILSITLTYKLEGFEEGDRIARAGFPFRDLDRYLPRLVRAGKRIAICDQIE